MFRILFMGPYIQTFINIYVYTNIHIYLCLHASLLVVISLTYASLLVCVKLLQSSKEHHHLKKKNHINRNNVIKAVAHMLNFHSFSFSYAHSFPALWALKVRVFSLVFNVWGARACCQHLECLHQEEYIVLLISSPRIHRQSFLCLLCVFCIFLSSTALGASWASVGGGEQLLLRHLFYIYTYIYLFSLSVLVNSYIHTQDSFSSGKINLPEGSENLRCSSSEALKMQYKDLDYF